MRWTLALPPLLALLAGCAGPSGGGPGGEGVGVVTDPRDTSYLQDAAPGPHVHDYWGGRDRLVVVDAAWSGSRWSCSGGCQDGMFFAWVRPGEGLIVPQGTRWVNGTFTVAPDPDDTYTGLELWVKTAGDDELRRWGPIESGVPFSVGSSQGQNDPPHYVLSLWQFEVKALGGDSISAGGDMAWSVEAVRGLPLVPYPPHPDRWGGADRLDLLSERGGTLLAYEMQDPMGGHTVDCTDGCPAVHVPADGVVVPHDASRVEVRLKVDGGVPAGLGLWVHGADTWAWAKATGELAGPGEAVYAIPVEAGMGDSPYAPQSLWELRVWFDQPQPVLHGWTGQYSISAVAFRSG